MTTSKLITKRDLRKVFFRSFPMEWTWNYEKQQNLGYTYALIPIIEKLYKDKPEEKAAALQRHLEFFNTTPHMVTLILGRKNLFIKVRKEICVGIVENAIL